MGVERALKIAHEAVRAEREKGGKVYTFGALIHNKSTLEHLEAEGVFSADEDEIKSLEGKNIPVVIRAHGVPPDVEKRLSSYGATITDATCPKVKANQLLAQKLVSSPNALLFIAGDKNHAEMAGVLGYAPGAIPVNSYAEAGAIALNEKQKRKNNKNENYTVSLLAQTTFSVAHFNEISSAIKNVFPELKVYCTICNATDERQSSLVELCNHVDMVIIVGSETSANTVELCDIALALGKKTFRIENAINNNITDIVYGNRDIKIGIASGASTPKEIVNSIVTQLESL
jgi:4-hydroxy-3-methylbut-2-enyl diphosphate reductase